MDVTKLKNISVDSIENILGEQTSNISISGYPCKSDKCYKRTYTNQKYEVIIDEDKIRTLKIIGIPSNLYRNDQALYSLGVKIDKEPAFYNESLVRRYNVRACLKI